jgi:hypothetical protein
VVFFFVVKMRRKLRELWHKYKFLLSNILLFSEYLHIH